MRANIFATVSLCLLGAGFATLTAPLGSADLADVGPELQFGATGPMVAHVMKDMADALGAVCLDGSPGAFFFSPAADAANANNWQIYFQGGGKLAIEWPSTRIPMRASIALLRRCCAARSPHHSFRRHARLDPSIFS